MRKRLAIFFTCWPRPHDLCLMTEGTLLSSRAVPDKHSERVQTLKRLAKNLERLQSEADRVKGEIDQHLRNLRQGGSGEHTDGKNRKP